jgi:hypothetical protein
MFRFQLNTVILSTVNILKMEDNIKIFNGNVINKTVAGVTIFAVTVCAVKEIELHSSEIFHQDQIYNTIAATGAYGGQAIGGDWLI